MLEFQKTAIFVINLTKSTERKANIEKQFSDLAEQGVVLNYHFFEAINGNENPDNPLFKKYNREKRLLRKGYELSLSQLGCFASHYLLWQKCVELNQPILVLEDDALLQPNFADVYQFCGSAENRFEFFWLFPSFKKQKGKLHFRHNNITLFQYRKGFSSATGYYLTPNAANKFLAYTNQEWWLEVDNTMDRFYENHVLPLAIEPYCIIADSSQETNISLKRKEKDRRLTNRIQRGVFNLKDNITRLIYLFKNR